MSHGSAQDQSTPSAYVNGKHMTSLNGADVHMGPNGVPESLLNAQQRRPARRRPVSSALPLGPPPTVPSLQERPSSGNLQVNSTPSTSSSHSPSMSFDFTEFEQPKHPGTAIQNPHYHPDPKTEGNQTHSNLPQNHSVTPYTYVSHAQLYSESLNPPATTNADLVDISPVSTSEFYEAQEDPNLIDSNYTNRQDYHPLPQPPAQSLTSLSSNGSGSGPTSSYYPSYPDNQLYQQDGGHEKAPSNPYSLPSDSTSFQNTRLSLGQQSQSSYDSQNYPTEDPFNPTYNTSVQGNSYITPSSAIHQQPIPPLNTSKVSQLRTDEITSIGPTPRTSASTSSAGSQFRDPASPSEPSALRPTTSSISAGSTVNSTGSGVQISSQTSLPKSNLSSKGRASTDSTNTTSKEKPPTLHKELGIGTGSSYVKTLRKSSATVCSDISSKTWGLPIGISDKGRSSIPGYSAFAPSKNYLRRAMDIKHSHLTPRLLASEVDEEEEEEEAKSASSDMLRTSSNTNLVNHNNVSSKLFHSSFEQISEDSSTVAVPEKIIASQTSATSKPPSINRRDSGDSVESIEDNIGKIRLFVANPDSD